jgi:adenosylcobinamide-GDP ribazoletransferase
MSNPRTAASGLARRELHSLATSVTFLTRVPIGVHRPSNGDDLANSTVWFPLVGMLIGVLVGAVAQLCAQVVSPLLAAVLGVGAGVVLTGALHVDALGDTCDAMGTRSRDRALDVMRESTLGTYGVISIVIDLLVRVAAVEVLVAHHAALVYCALAGTLSRLAPVLLAGCLEYARVGPGLGRGFTRVSKERVVVAMTFALVLALLTRGLRGALSFLSVLALTALTGRHYQRWLGGVTGDTLGASCEASEVLVLVMGAAFVGQS